MKNVYIAGLDIGSQSTCAVIWGSGRIWAFSVLPSGVNPQKRGEEALAEALTKSGLTLKDLDAIIATGYGRYQVEAHRQVSEISCQAKGVHFFFPQVRTVIDLGGQDSKVILVDPRTGRVLDFLMNDKCAAGTGRFLELMARVLEIELEDYGKLITQGKEDLVLANTCAVFAESEVVGLIAQGKERADIARAVCKAVAQRVVQLAERMGLAEPIAITGGVARNRGVLHFLEREIGASLLVPEEPLLTAALGACLLEG